MKNKIGWCDMTWNAYIAGLFDGEGSAIILTIKRPNLRRPFRFRPKILIAQKDRYVLDKIEEYLKIGKVVEDSFNTHKYIIFNHEHIFRFIKKIHQYSLIKEQQLRLLLRYINIATIKGNRSYNRRELNHIITIRDNIHFLNQTTRELKYDRHTILEANLYE